MSTKPVHFSAQRPFTDRTAGTKEAKRVFKPTSAQARKTTAFSPKRHYTIDEKAISFARIAPLLTVIALVTLWYVLSANQWPRIYAAVFVFVGIISLFVVIAAALQVHAQPSKWVDKQDARMAALYTALNRSSYDADERQHLATMIAGRARKLNGTPENTAQLYIATRAIMSTYFIDAHNRKSADLPITAIAEEAIDKLHIAYKRFSHSELVDSRLAARLQKLSKEAQRKHNAITASTQLEAARLQEEARAEKKADADTTHS